MRDIEAAFTDRTGHCVLCRTAVSPLTERLWEDYQAFAGRDLSEHRISYLFVDGIAERLHLGQPREAVLAAWDITESGQRVLLGLAPGAKEDTVSYREFRRDLIARGQVDPILVITDGAPGLIRAAEDVFPRSLRQRCLAHKVRNLEAKVPAELWREVKARALGPTKRQVRCWSSSLGAGAVLTGAMRKEVPPAVKRITQCHVDPCAPPARQVRSGY